MIITMYIDDSIDFGYSKRYTVYDKFSGRIMLNTDSFKEASGYIRQNTRKTCTKYVLYDKKLRSFDTKLIRDTALQEKSQIKVKVHRKGTQKKITLLHNTGGETMTLQEIVNSSKRIVFFGGAGVSTESGIPDFRSVDGLYNQKYDYPPEEILSHTFFMKKTDEFYRFYRDKMLCISAKPNKAHLKLAEMEKKGILSAVITQNIDGLHQAAGSQNVLELHGSVLRNYCMECGRFYTADDILNSEGIPTCSCGGVIKPDVVLYEEGLDNNTVTEAVKQIENCDTLIIAGTSLTVYPAAGMVRYFRGRNLVLINRDATPMDSQADLVIHEKVGEVLSEIKI